MSDVAEVAAEAAPSFMEHVDTIANVTQLTAQVVIPFAQFIPLIKEVASILNEVTDLYKTAQHNKEISRVLIERISAANTTVNMLQAREDLYTSYYYKSLQRLVGVLHSMEKFIAKITKYNTVQKYIVAKTIEKDFESLCKEYDSSISSLSFNLTAQIKFDSDREMKILKSDLEELLKFQGVLTSMNQNISDVVDQVSEMHSVMQKLLDDKIDPDQSKIDSIFHEEFLNFNDYEEAGPEGKRGEVLRKYIHKITREEYAFKAVDQEQANQFKNQVTILKKLKDCQNIIQFYGLTKDSGDKIYLVTEWAENRNLREFISERGQSIETRLKLRIAFDIAKGLNFINSVNIVHRDIRSENVVITEHDVAKITNFKLSRGSNQATGNLSVNRECVRYSAPELLRRGITGEDPERGDKSHDNKHNDKTKDSGTKCPKYDTKCEVYSFGILLWEIAECKVPYDNEQFEDFVEISKKVVKGYREKFSPDTDIPEAYQNLVNRSVDQNPGLRPVFSKMLTELHDIFKSYDENLKLTNGNNSIKSSRKQPIRQMTIDPTAAEECVVDFGNIMESFNYISIDKAVELHKENMKNNPPYNKEDLEKCYKCFDYYANMDNPRAKYWKAYYITKGWSDLECSSQERLKISAKLYKEAADYGDEIPDAQLRYATMVMGGKGVKQNMEEAIEYFLKAAKNDHVVAMFNVATYYFSVNKSELGNYYMIKAASKEYKQAIDYCKKKNINY